MTEALVDFLYELGQLKRTRRSGWSRLGIPQPESIADHSWRTAMIAFILATMEGADAKKAALLGLVHELGEARIGDLDKVQLRYFPNKEAAETAAVKEQLSQLPERIKDGIAKLMGGLESDSTPEQIILRDADYLECLVQAREYMDQGYAGAKNWFENAKGNLWTKSAKKLAAAIEQRRSTAWYEGLKRIER